MSRYNHKHNWAKKDYLFRVLGTIFCTAILVLFMPREKNLNFNFSVGEPWDGKALFARSSFPILKSEAMLQMERDSINRYIEPYFRRNGEIASQQLIALREAFAQGMPVQNPHQLQQYLEERLGIIYDRGVLSTNDYRLIAEKNVTNIRIYEEQKSFSRYFREVFSTKSAYEFLISQLDENLYPKATLAQCDLNRFIKPNCLYDSKKSEQQESEVISMMVPYMGQVVVGQKIVDQGEIINEHTYQVLYSLVMHEKEIEMTNAELLRMFGGQILFVLCCVLALLTYFIEFRSDYMESWRYINLVVLLFLAFPLMTFSLVQRTDVSPYVIPYCIVPIFIRIFMDSRTAFVTHFATIILTSIVVSDPMPFVIVESIAGLAAIYSLRDLTQRSELFRTVVIVLISSVLVYLSLMLAHGKIESILDFFDMEHNRDFIAMAISAGLVLISYLVLVPIEKILGFTSSITLLELSNANSPILRRLAEEAPGTFQHSMQVANLAAAVAERIGAKSQLARTGALYHDIGKIRHAVFFTENQNTINPHNRLSPEQSARIIISHVKEGEQLAEKHQLPKSIRDFITTHHGNSVARFFYTQAQNNTPDETVDPAMFTYPGPNPQTAEQAILMMCDAVEAASRSLKEVNEENLSELVEKIVGGQFKAGYFDECPITFKDIAIAKEVLITKLRTIYHTRIQYPELKVQTGSTSA